MRFHGKVGYGLTVETSPGVWETVIDEKSHFGNVLRSNWKLTEGEKVNSDLSVGNSISIVADAFANRHLSQIKYVEWAGVRWAVTSVDVQSPRLILQLGEVYNGPQPA